MVRLCLIKIKESQKLGYIPSKTSFPEFSHIYVQFQGKRLSNNLFRDLVLVTCTSRMSRPPSERRKSGPSQITHHKY